MIYALATGVGGAIAILRLTGQGCHTLGLNCLRTARGARVKPRPRTMHYARLVDANDNVVDEVCAVFFPKNSSYTGEEMLEIHCHGSSAIVAKAAAIFRSLGAEPAQPGEFTRRAFIHGKLDLNQAEAVRELIEADNEIAATLAIRQFKGELKNRIEDLRQELIDCAASVEATLDYPEEDIEHIANSEIITRIQALIQKIEFLLIAYERQRRLRQGLSIALIGEPNAGKSSLLNALLKTDRAIVTEIPGTTRDSIEEALLISGIKFRILDTAGIRDSSDPIESLGIQRSLKAEQEADLTLYMYDGSKPVCLRQSSGVCLHLLNKSDLPLHESNRSLLDHQGVLRISALRHDGLEALADRLTQFGRETMGKLNLEDIPLTSERQAHALKEAKQSLEGFIHSLSNHIPVDIALVELYEARDHLGQITGAVVSADILDRIFEKFCIGK